MDIGSGQPIDIRTLLDGGNPLQVIVEDARGPYSKSTANRIISYPARTGVLRRALASTSRQVAASHLVDEFSQYLLSDGDDESFLIGRSVTVQAAIAAHVDRMAEWGARDGRAITDIIRSVA